MSRFDDTNPFLVLFIFFVIAAINLAWIGVLIWAIIQLVQWLVAK